MTGLINNGPIDRFFMRSSTGAQELPLALSRTVVEVNVGPLGEKGPDEERGRAEEGTGTLHRDSFHGLPVSA